jgi:hypothetical protein
VLTNPTSDAGAGPPQGLALPPVGFYCPRSIWSAGRSAEPWSSKPTARPSPAQRAGLRYQATVEKRLSETYGPAVELGPWFRYVDDSHRPRWCQPDAVILAPGDGGAPLVVEVKLRWMDTAWWQLRCLYLPVLERVFGSAFRTVAVVRSFDPAVVVPGPVHLVDSLAAAPSSDVGVVIWR